MVAKIRQILYRILSMKFFAPIKKMLRRLFLTYKKYQFQKIFQQKRKNAKQLAIIMATPCHGNLGDQAIVYAEYEMLLRCGYKNAIVEISNDDYKRYKELIHKYICVEDIIIIDGGGNLGTLWPWEDDKISEIIESYQKNKILVFPQTCYYDSTHSSQERLQRNYDIYKKAESLTIYLRDRKSYDFCKNHFENVNFEYAPDIVLYLEKNQLTEQRAGCALCFRKDLEKVVFDTEIADIRNELLKCNIETIDISTIYPGNVSKKEREERLYEIWNRIASAKLVLTDRLHCMIFAAITATPCLALDNKSKKLSGVFEWIQKLPYVKVCSTTQEMMENIIEFYQIENQKYSILGLKEFFSRIEDKLK